MKKLIFSLVGGCLLFSGPLSADSLILDTNAFSDSFGGGEFTASNSALDLSSYSPLALTTSAHGRNGFSTFCMEYNEEFFPGKTYNFSLSNSATGGDLPSGSDPISLGTAWLYSQFALGELTNYDYMGSTTQRRDSALQLQLAFWYLEDETSLYYWFLHDHPSFSGFDWGTNIFVASALNRFSGSVATAKSDANGAFGVQAVNLTSTTGWNGCTTEVNNQSQLYFHAVPDTGSTVLLLGLSLVVLALVYRRTLC